MSPTGNTSLIDTARALMAGGKGLLAMDESNATCDQRFAAAGIAPTVEARRAWRELLITTPGLSSCISGAILFDETIHQATASGQPFVELLSGAGIVAGIKVDTGAKALAGHPGEKVTEGLDGLRERLQAYFERGARFAKWRAVIAMADTSATSVSAAGPRLPSQGCIEANAHALARYAALCQEAGLVPVVEPEVLMEGSHTLARCAEVTEELLGCMFDQLRRQRVVLEAMILKPNMVTSGSGRASGSGADPQQPDSAEAVADATVQCLLRTVPAAVPGVAFLSGGQTGAQAAERLNAMNARVEPAGTRDLPWPLTFSFARAIQHPALEVWGGKPAHAGAAQQALLHRARCASAASRGAYRGSMESD